MTEPQIDRGWAWVVMGAVFVNMMLGSVIYMAGIFNVYFLEVFSYTKSTTALCGSLHTSTFQLVGPLSSLVINRLGSRKTVLLGATLVVAGFIATAFSTSFPVIFFTYGIVSSVGLGLCYMSGYVLLSFYFCKYRNFVYGVTTMGSGFGTMFMAQLLTFLISIYGWRGGMIILAGVCTHFYVTGSLLRPVKKEQVHQKQSEPTAEPEQEPSQLVAPSHVLETVQEDQVLENIGPAVYRHPPRPITIVQNNHSHRLTGSLHGSQPGGVTSASEPGASSLPEQPFMFKYGHHHHPHHHSHQAKLGSTLGSDILEESIMESSTEDNPVRDPSGEVGGGLQTVLPVDVITEEVLGDAVTSRGATRHASVQTEISGINTNLSFGKASHAGGKSGTRNLSSMDEQLSTWQKIMAKFTSQYSSRKARSEVVGRCTTSKASDMANACSVLTMHTSDDNTSAAVVADGGNRQGTSANRATPLGFKKTRTSSSRLGDPRLLWNNNVFSRMSSDVIATSYVAIELQQTVNRTASSSRKADERAPNDDESEDVAPGDATLWEQLQALRDKRFTLFVLNLFLLSFALSAVYLHLAAFAVDAGSTVEQAGNLMSILGFFNLMARFCSGVISSLSPTSPLYVYSLTNFLAGIVLMVAPTIGGSYGGQLAIAAMYGCSGNAFVPLIAPILISIVGLDAFTLAYGFQILACGIGFLLGPPLAGFLFDKLTTYTPTFYAAGAFYILGSIIIMQLIFIENPLNRQTSHEKCTQT